MSDIEAIIEAIGDWSQQGIGFALATVVGVRGSTYRGLGARQLVGADGSSVGTVSGGCLDQDLHRVAERVIDSGAAEIVEFDLTADDEAVWGWGIGCNGATELLVEPPIVARRWADDMIRLRALQRPTAVMFSLDDPPGIMRTITYQTVGDPPDPFERLALDALGGGHNVVGSAEGRPVFVELVAAPSKLLVCGAGHDAAPVAEFGTRLGFDVVVVDDRRPFLGVERFPTAGRLVLCPPSEVASHVEVDERTYAVVMSHNYLRDLDYLRSLIDTDVVYLGLLGPGARLDRLLSDLAREGRSLDPDSLARMHGPAGLDIGAEGPDEIAWAILSEVMAVRRGAEGTFLRSRKGPEVLRRL